MKTLRKFIIKYKEVGSDSYRTTSYEGYLSEEEIVKFFGLNDSDVEDYEIIFQKELNNKTGF